MGACRFMRCMWFMCLWIPLSCSEAEIAVAVARQREMKWLDMFRNWDKWVSRRFQKVCFLFKGSQKTFLTGLENTVLMNVDTIFLMQVKIRCRKGIPSSLRAKAWQLLSNSQELLESNPGKFEVWSGWYTYCSVCIVMALNQLLPSSYAIAVNCLGLTIKGLLTKIEQSDYIWCFLLYYTINCIC